MKLHLRIIAAMIVMLPVLNASGADEDIEARVNRLDALPSSVQPAPQPGPRVEYGVDAANDGPGILTPYEQRRSDYIEGLIYCSKFRGYVDRKTCLQDVNAAAGLR